MQGECQTNGCGSGEHTGAGPADRFTDRLTEDRGDARRARLARRRDDGKNESGFGDEFDGLGDSGARTEIGAGGFTKDRSVAFVPKQLFEVGLGEAGDGAAGEFTGDEVAGGADVGLSGAVTVGEEVPGDAQGVGKLDEWAGSTLGVFDATDAFGVEVEAAKAREFGEEPELAFALDEEPTAGKQEAAAAGADVIAEFAAIGGGERTGLETVNPDALMAHEAAEGFEGNVGEQVGGIGGDNLLAGGGLDGVPHGAEEVGVEVGFDVVEDHNGAAVGGEGAGSTGFEDGAEPEERHEALDARSGEQRGESGGAAAAAGVEFGEGTLPELLGCRAAGAELFGGEGVPLLGPGGGPFQAESHQPGGRAGLHFRSATGEQVPEGAGEALLVAAEQEDREEPAEAVEGPGAAATGHLAVPGVEEAVTGLNGAAGIEAAGADAEADLAHVPGVDVDGRAELPDEGSGPGAIGGFNESNFNCDLAGRAGAGREVAVQKSEVTGTRTGAEAAIKSKEDGGFAAAVLAQQNGEFVELQGEGSDSPESAEAE
jgi:hypothetical protein